MERENKHRVEYSSNNSGGRWWLSDDQWKALEAAGWVVDWFAKQDRTGLGKPDESGRWLGALASSAVKYGVTMKEAVANWEDVTGLDSTDAGCPCCGQPHWFSEEGEDGKIITSGPSAEYRCEW